VSRVKNFLLLAFYFLVVNGLALLSAAWAVISLGRGEYPTVVVVLAFAFAFVGLEASLLLVMLGKVTPRAEYTDQGTTIRPDRAVDGLLQWATVAAVIAVTTYAIFTPLKKIDIPLPYGKRMFLVLAIGTALTGIANLWTLLKRGGVSFLRLHQHGFELGQGISSVDGAWDDIADIADRRPGKSPPFRATLFVVFHDGRTRTVAVDSYTPKGAALRRFVRFYWLNPDQRGELTDGRAVQRLADERFASGSS
jgi:hypothetical protein